MNQSLVENNARMFATITNEANMMLPLLTQSFDIRIKSNSKSFEHLRYSMSSAEAAKLLGKTLSVKVDWGACGGVDKQSFMWLIINGTREYILMQEDDLNAIVTQKGIAPKMFATWKLAAGK